VALPLVDGAINFRGAPLEQVAGTMYAELAASAGFRPPPLDQIADVAPVRAYVNQGRWIVDCPDCRGAEFVWLAGPPIMLCASCWNQMIGGLWRPVALPDAETLATVTMILIDRPLALNRNWTPGETLTELANENLAHAAELRPVES
jgi:hypothetical protein